MDEQYKISLGVDVDLSDIQSQINAEASRIKPKIKVDIDADDLARKLQRELGRALSGSDSTLKLDTSGIVSALDEVKDIIGDIRKSIGSIDGNGFKDLLSSINQIAKALGKAEDESKTLVSSLNALANKDFNINFGIKMGGSNQISRNAAYGNKARRETLPELQSQVAALEGFLQQYYKVTDGFVAAQKLVQGTGAATSGRTLLDIVPKMFDTSGSLSSQMSAYKDYISLIKDAASIKGSDLSHITSGFSKSADQLVQDAVDVQTGAKEMEDGFERLRQIFGGGNSFNAEGISAQLDSVINNLGEIKIALKDLSSGFSIDGLTESFDRLSASIDRLVRDCGEARTAVSSVVSGSGASGVVSGGGIADEVEGTAEDLKTSYNKLKNISKNIGSIRIKLSDGLDATDDVNQIKVLERQLRSLTDEYHSTVDKIKGKGDLSSTQWQTIQQQIDNTKIKLEQLEAEIVDARNKVAQKIELRLERGDFDNDISSINSRFDKLSDKSDETRIAIEGVERALADIRTASASGDVEALISANERYERSLKDVKNQLDINARAERDAFSVATLEQAKSKLSLDMSNWLRENSAAAKDFGGRIRELQAQISSCDKTSLAGLRAEFNNIKKEAQLAGKQTLSLSDKLKKQFSNYSSYLSVASLFSYAWQGLRDMFQQVVAIDTAMTELKKVTNETDASYNNFLTNAAKRSKELATTIDGLIESTADFARLGYGFEESQRLAEVANIYAVVGDEIEGVDEATKSLVSTLAAYKDEASGISDTDFAMDIVDKFNEVSNNFAISSGGIGEAMQRSASSLRAANNTIDESIALITAANTVVVLCHAA